MGGEKFIEYMQDNVTCYLANNGKIARAITMAHIDIYYYIYFDELLQKLADKSIAYDKKRDMLRKYLQGRNIDSWYSIKGLPVDDVPHLQTDLTELLPFNQEYTPHVKAYLRWGEKLLQAVTDTKSTNPLENEDVMLQSLIDELQSEQTQIDFKKAKKACNRTNRRMKKYIDNLIAYKANLLVIRLDLAYNKHYLDNSRHLMLNSISRKHCKKMEEYIIKKQSSENTMLENQLNSIKNYRAKFFKDIKKQYDVVGFIWKLEYGMEKGFHYHCLLMLDGDKHREDVKIAKNMGELWNKIAKDDDGVDKGIYWNCNAFKEKYNHLAIGQLNASNTEMINNLFKYTLPYLAKTDYYIKSVKNNDRTIGMGGNKSKQKSGRPRKSMTNS